MVQLWNTFHAPEDVEAALDDSLAKLGTDYVVRLVVSFREERVILMADDIGLVLDALAGRNDEGP